MSRARGEGGAVTAELAMALPLLLALTVGLVWVLGLCSAQVRMVDATREAARALARGDSPDEALARARSVAPDGARLTVGGDAALVVVRGTADVAPFGLGGLASGLSVATVSAEATAAREEPPVSGPVIGPMTRQGDERGAATLLVLTMAGVLLFVASGLGMAGALVVDHRRAQAAADLAALAAAQSQVRGGPACEAAGEVAGANGAELTSCAVAGDDVVVEVRVEGPSWPGWQAELLAGARAGPSG